MKNSKFLKLISLALTVALLIAVAVPTLTTSAEDTTTPAYVKELSYTFEDGERHTNNGAVTDGKGVNDSKCLDITAGSNRNIFFDNTYMKAGVTYFVSFTYMSHTPGPDNYPWFNQVYDTNNAQYGVSVGYNQTGPATSWRTYSKQITPDRDSKFGIVTQDGYYIDNFYIVEQSTENTATKQTYTFDSHDFSYLTTNGKSITVLEKNQKISAALTVDTSSADVNAAPGQIQPILDYPLTAGKYYKLSYDIKGKGDIAISMTSGAWGKEQYKTETYGQTYTSLIIDTEAWKHHESVFQAQYNSTHLFIRGSNGGTGAKIYLDNFVIEEYDYPTTMTFDFENEILNFENMVIADDPIDTQSGNKAMKYTATAYNNGYGLNGMRIRAGHTYSVTYRHTGGSDFRFDMRDASGNFVKKTNSNDADSAYYAWTVSSKTGWKTTTQVFTATEKVDNGMFAFLCQSANYIDDITITDVTSFDVNSDVLDFGSESGTLMNHTENTTVTKVQDEEKGTVTKLTFNEKCQTNDGKVSIPFVLEKGKTYIFKITYKSDAWVALQWAEKVRAYDERVQALNSNPLTKTNAWTTVTRYVQGVTDDLGTGSDTIHFFSEAGGGNLYIANVTITEVTAEGGPNGDGVIDTTDYTLMRERFFSAKRDDTRQFEKYADQNGDKTVDVLDMVLLSKIGK